MGEVMFYCEKPKGLPAEWHVLLQNVSQDTIHDAELRDIEVWIDEVIARHRSNHPYYFLQAKLINVAYYAPFVDFAADNIYHADLDDYPDPGVFDFLMHIHDTGGPQAGTGWQLVRSPAISGRIWPSAPTS